MKRGIFSVGFCLLLAFTLCLGGNALAKYPDSPVNLVVAFKAGGSLDATFRVFAKALGDELGQPVVVSNRAGAGGAVGASNLKMEKPDGYTVGANVSLPFTLSTLISKTNYQISDFDYLSGICFTQPAFVASPKKGWKTWADLVAAGKKKGMLTFASQTPWDKLAAKVISKKVGFTLAPVPTKGGGEMVPSLLGGHVDFAWSGGVHYKYAKAGKMVVLAACTSDPLMAFPKVPTLMQLGYDISMDVPFMLVLPKGVPMEVKKTLEKASLRAFNHKDVQNLLKEKLHMPAVFMDSARITELIVNSHESYKSFLKK
jgi:tripartite-type tricarboxylate transporter receptor subunit TctC